MSVAIQTSNQVSENLAKQQEARQISLAEEEPEFVTQLAGQIGRDWQRNRDNKTTTEHNMLECLRERKGEYGPTELSLIEQAGGSDIYLKEATGKIRAGIAHIKSIHLPAGERAHGIRPTKDPEIPPHMEDMILDRIMNNPNMVDAEGQPINPSDQIKLLEAMGRREIQRHANLAALKMDRLINDQLQEGGWNRAMSDFIDDFCTYPAAFLRGPFFKMEPVLKYQLQKTGQYRPVSTVAKKVAFGTINPFDAYPAPGVDSVQKGVFIERLRMTKKDLYRMRKMPGYNEQAIIDVMMDDNNGKLHEWLWTDTSRESIAGHDYFWYKSLTDLDGLHWYGSTQGSSLIEWGMDERLIDDPLDFYEVDAIKVGRHVVRAAINPDPKYRRPIGSACYERIPGNVFGNSISMLMRSTSRMINATARSLQNNLAHSAGFQMEVNHRRISSETDVHDVHPFKVWQTEESEQATNGAPAVRFFQPTSNAQELQGIIGYFREVADSDTGIPSVLQGGGGTETGADGTARGRSMLLQSSAKLLRSSITNIDEDIVTPALQMLYDINMLDPNVSDDAKGDTQVVATGANEMLQRETARQEHMAMLEITNNPTDAAIVGTKGRAYLLKKTLGTFENIDHDQVIPSGEEFDSLVDALDNQQPPPDPAMVKIDADNQLAQQKLSIESQRMELEERMAEENRRADRILKTMELATKEKVSEDDMRKTVENEVIKLKAARMSERAKQQMDLKLFMLKAESDARIKVHDAQEARKKDAQEREYKLEDVERSDKAAVASSDSAKDEQRLARRLEMVKSGMIAPDDLEEDAMKPEDIRAIVSEVVEPLARQFGESTKAMTENTNRVIDSLTEKLSEERERPINVTVEAAPVPKKTMTFTKDKNGNVQGTVTAVEGDS